MIYLLSPEARDDLDDAAAYYERMASGGGVRFLERYEKAAERILDSPESLPKYEGPTRISLIARSNHGIVYLPTDEAILVVGVICLVRKPRYWKKRLRKYRRE